MASGLVASSNANAVQFAGQYNDPCRARDVDVGGIFTDRPFHQFPLFFPAYSEYLDGLYLNPGEANRERKGDHRIRPKSRGKSNDSHTQTVKSATVADTQHACPTKQPALKQAAEALIMQYEEAARHYSEQLALQVSLASDQRAN